MNDYCIYKHENKINHKVYIGQTNQEVSRRWRNGKGYVDSPRFYAAIQKYGWDNFEHIILETDLSSEEANDREVYWIAYYNSFDENYGYNLTPGGNNYMKELWNIPEYREKMCESFSKARQKSWENPEFREKAIKNLIDGSEKSLE